MPRFLDRISYQSLMAAMHTVEGTDCHDRGVQGKLTVGQDAGFMTAEIHSVLPFVAARPRGVGRAIDLS